MFNSLKLSIFEPFAIRSFRFQWPADLMTSWAFEMEILILGWYVLTVTDSVLILAVFASMQWLGTLIAPFLGVLGDRWGRRRMLCLLRSSYLFTSIITMTLALGDALSAPMVLGISFLIGLVRPSDLVMRNGLIGDTMPGKILMKAMGVSRTTMDSARIAGALLGAGLFSVLGIGHAYIVVAVFYIISLLLTLGVSSVRIKAGLPNDFLENSPLNDLKKGLQYVWNTPTLLASMWLAFLVNLTVFPISHGILPFVAKEVYLTDENGLSHLVASYAAGALLGSITMTLVGVRSYPARFMILNIFLMHIVIIIIGQIETKLTGQFLLALAGYVQSLAMISMAVTLLSIADEKFRGLVMGVRMLAVYGLPVGLIGAGILIEWFSYSTTVNLYGVGGLFFTGLIAFKWRREIWWNSN
ncbi:MAG: MFS transporter [Alphaproteobacteria bacterium]|nr:MFS transporter [Alphaproteobacteria bacterium]MDG1887805.1 MFS transporter [Alphaproteobacteria bacterium]